MAVKNVGLNDEIQDLLEKCANKIAPGADLKYPQILKTIANAYLETNNG